MTEHLLIDPETNDEIEWKQWMVAPLSAYVVELGGGSILVLSTMGPANSISFFPPPASLDDREAVCEDLFDCESAFNFFDIKFSTIFGGNLLFGLSGFR